MRLRAVAAIHGALERACFYLVCGGYAHEAMGSGPEGPHVIELMCFRVDAETVRGALAKIGVALVDERPSSERGRVHRMAAVSEHVLVHLLDEAPDNTFDVSFDGLPPRRFPLHMIVPRAVTLERVLFPIPQESFLRRASPFFPDATRDPGR